jgi:threonine dehydrogenase-like Zn-dependent dehydrogenase
MKGVVLVGDRQVEIRDYPDPKPGPGQALVAMKASGLCGSDFSGYRAPKAQRGDPAKLPIAGHEPVGVIAALGPGVTGPKVGTRCIIHHYEGCGNCKFCRIGYPQLCVVSHTVRGFSADGGHADYMVIDAHMCLPMPDVLTFEEAAAIACGTGTAYAAVKKLDVSGRDVFAVFGQGPVGASATVFGAATGAAVIAIDPVPERLELAKKLGAWKTVDPSKQDPVAAVRELTHGEGADATVDCTGINKVRWQTVDSAKVFGRACFVGEGGDVTLQPSPQIIHKHLTLYGSWTFSTVLLSECCQYVVDRKIPLKQLITHTFPLSQAAEAYKLFDTNKTGKVVLVWK